MSTHPLEEIFHPQSVAVVGARGTPGARGYELYSSLIDCNYRGKIYPVNPKYPELMGIKAYPSVREIPGAVDYVISVVPAAEVLRILDDCSLKRVKALCLYTAGFAETGRREAAELEQEILKKARRLGIRLIGPNCLGIHYPREGLSFRGYFPKEPGPVGAFLQSGGVTSELIPAGSLRGIRFSKVVSYGNALDLNECDFLDYFSQDPETKIILMYVEGVKDGERFFCSLSRATSTKPVIILKGGRGKSGARATASHTASLAGSMQVWQTLLTQAGAVSVADLDEMVDLAVSFYFLPPIRGRRVGVVGGGGGSSVMAADQCEEAGLDVVPLPAEIREELKSRGDPIWDWVSNPVDGSIRANDSLATGDMLQMMARHPNFDLLITTMGMGGAHQGNQPRGSVEAHLERFKLAEIKSKPLLAVMPDESSGDTDYDDWKFQGEVRRGLVAANIPIYPTMGRAARAARKLIDYYQKRDKQGNG